MQYRGGMENKDSFTLFDGLIWGGATISVLGLAALIWCIVRVARARAAKLDEEAMRAVLQSVVPINLAALMTSALGLMIVVMGIVLG